MNSAAKVDLSAHEYRWHELLTLYHYTDTARLPWILGSELCRGLNRLGGFPEPDFLWTTASRAIDRTAAGAANRTAFRQGRLHIVLRAVARAVKPWPTWTPEDIARLERKASGKSSPSDWWCRINPLPRERWRGIEVRTWASKRWEALPTDTTPYLIRLPDDVNLMGVAFDGTMYTSAMITLPNGARGYQVMPQAALEDFIRASC